MVKVYYHSSMSRRPAKYSLAAALLLFCVQVLAAPLFGCCAAPSGDGQPAAHGGVHSAHPVGHQSGIDMAVTDLGETAHEALHDMHMGHMLHVQPEYTGDLHDATPTLVPGVDCEHQCNYCLGLSSTAVLDQNLQMTPVLAGRVLPSAMPRNPLHLSSPLLRPPRFA